MRWAAIFDDSAYRENAARIAARLQATDPVATACALLERF